VTGRPYVARESLLSNARNVLARVDPFLEVHPYCFDFDIVQILRTSAQPGELTIRDVRAASQLGNSIATFLSEQLPDDYTLHKLPGALAALHECAMVGDAPVPR